MVLAGVLFVTLGGLRLWRALTPTDPREPQTFGAADPTMGFLPMYSPAPGPATSRPASPEARRLLPPAPLEQEQPAGSANRRLVEAPVGEKGSRPAPTPPTRLVIPAIGLDAPVVAAGLRQVEIQGQVYQQWLAPDTFAVGWHTTSARLGEMGNMVLNGHHNLFGEVFRRLEEVQEGDRILVFGGEAARTFVVVTKQILPERDQPIEVRLQNARWIQPTEDERLTLITCWPYTSNTHRLVVVAVPVERASLDGLR